jgi:peptidoglycan/LPS O-acetylase OafA/YrhL
MVLAFVIYTPIFHIPQFLIGVCAGVIFLRINSQKRNTMFFKGGVLSISLAIALFIIALIQVFKIPYEFLNNGLIAPVFASIIFALAHGKGAIARFLSLPVFILLGEASYAIYLFQNPLISALKIFFSKVEILGIVSSNFSSSFLFLLSYLTILISFSLFVSRFLETPLRRMINSKLN